MSPLEYAVCEVLRDGRPVGLGFAMDRSHVLTCAHVVNVALGRVQREPGDPGAATLRVRFRIGLPAGLDGERSATLAEWLPGDPAWFDQQDLALLELAGSVPEHVPELTVCRRRPPMLVQMWGPQDLRPDGGHVTGELLGEVPGGLLQVNADGGPFRVRTGFSGGPVWRPGTTDVVGILVACGQEAAAVDAYLLGIDRIALLWPEWVDAGLGAPPVVSGNLDGPDAVAAPPPTRSIPSEGPKVIEVGRHPRDIPNLEEAIAICEEEGADNSNALPFRSNLAHAYRSAGRLDDAISQFQQVVDGQTRLLGVGHLDTLNSRNDLAAALWQAGRLDVAMDLLQQVTEQAQVLGIGHPKTLAFRGNLASVYQSAGRLDEAIDLGQQVLAECERHPDLGPGHPLTASVRRDLEKSRRDRR